MAKITTKTKHVVWMCSGSPVDKDIKDEEIIMLNASISSSMMRTMGCCHIKVTGGLNKKNITKNMEVNHDWNGFQRYQRGKSWRQ